jgi:general secretion pathway protein F
MQFAFDLVVRTPDGAVRHLEVDASDATAARASAMRDGSQVMACAPRVTAVAGAGHARAGSRQRIDVATFSHELASLLAAGLSVVESLRTLAANEAIVTRRSLLLEVVDRVSEGLPLSAALDRPSGRFPPLLIATVSASEQTGDLPTSLLRYAEHQ